MKKSTIVIIISVVLIAIVGIYFLTKKSTSEPTSYIKEEAQDLPINTLDLAQRPFITLAPDTTGRSLDLTVSGAPQSGEMEYELIYNASGVQEGALGSIFLEGAKQPIVKPVLLGSKSGGGKITYHEGVTGGTITLTYGETRLKESWNYLKFDPSSPEFSTTDARLTIALSKTALKQDTVIVTMKTFGYPKAGLPESSKIISGPYGYFTQTAVKGSVSVAMKLPAGEHVNPTLYEWDGKTWKKLVTKLAGDTVSATATATANVFVVTAE